SRRLQEDFASWWRERPQRGDQAGVHARGNHEIVRVDVDDVAALVTADDAVGDRLHRRTTHVEITPVLVLQALHQRLGDRRRGAEIHVGAAHADLATVLAVDTNLR